MRNSFAPPSGACGRSEAWSARKKLLPKWRHEKQKASFSAFICIKNYWGATGFQTKCSRMVHLAWRCIEMLCISHALKNGATDLGLGTYALRGHGTAWSLMLPRCPLASRKSLRSMLAEYCMGRARAILQRRRRKVLYAPTKFSVPRRRIFNDFADEFLGVAPTIFLPSCR